MNPCRLMFPCSIALGLAMSLSALAEGEGDAATPLTFKELATATHHENAAPAIPAGLKKLDGKKVRLTGFVAPYDNPDSMTKLLITGAALGCFYCNPPQENEVVFVRLHPKAKPVSMDKDTITIEGPLHFMGHDKKDQEAEQFLFTIDEAKVVSQ